jgi:hypothetical protein
MRVRKAPGGRTTAAAASTSLDAGDGPPQGFELEPPERRIRKAVPSRDGLSQWRHYDPWLKPLCDALGDALVHYDE